MTITPSGHFPNDALEAALPAEPEEQASLAKIDPSYQLPGDGDEEQAPLTPGDVREQEAEAVADTDVGIDQDSLNQT